MKIGQDKQRKGQKMQILEKLSKKKCKRVSVALALAVMMPMTAIASPLGMLNAVEDPTSLERQLIPLPLNYEVNDGKFTLSSATKIYVQGETSEETDELYKTGEYAAEKFRASTGFDLPVIKGTATGNGHISITISDIKTNLGEEGYQINTTTDGVSIVAHEPAGAFRAVQTLRQLLPASIEKNEVVSDVLWEIPTSNIEDKPEYEYRGSMLDVSRHFFTVDEVKRHIDNMAQYKINKLHMHLSDDQGWRLEIKGSMYNEELSKLDTIGAQTSTSINGIKPGQYTQEEFKEIVAYAADRYIEIIPEFDMPGHSWAALVSLEFLNSTPDGKPSAGGYDNTKPYEGIDVGFSTFECRNEKTYEFIDEVFKQVSQISPSKYIHVGGDEAHSTSHDDYAYFMNQVSDIAKKYGKIPYGWQNYDDVVTDKEGTITQFWSTGNAKMKDGINYIMSPADHAYMDMKYYSDSEYGLQWAGLNPMDDTYTWDPADYGPKENIIGIEAPLWAETLATTDAIDYMAFPKIASLSEVGWTPKENRSWEDFQARLIPHAERLTNQGIKFFKDEKVWETPYVPVNAQWNMDEGEGTIISDRNVLYPGTMHGGVTWIKGKYGNGLSFDGTGYVDLNIRDLQGDWSIGLWVKRGENNSTNEVLLTGNEGEVKLEQWKNTGKVGITKFGVDDYTFDYSAPINEWVHLTFVSNEQGTTLYVNGTKQDHLNVTIAAPAKRIGANAKAGLADGGNMVGDLDEVKIYNRALSEAEVSKLVDRADKIELAAWLNKGQAINEAEYTAESYQVFKLAFDQAMAAYQDTSKTQAEVDQLTIALQEAYKALVKESTEGANKELLNGLIEKAELLETNGALDNVHETVVEYFNWALANAISVSTNIDATQEAVNKAYEQLAHAIQLLDFTVDKTVLKALIDECEAIDLKDYELTGQDEFKSALQNANDVYNNPNTLDEVSIFKAVDELTKAKANLKLKGLDTMRIEYIINLAQKAVNEANKYKQNEAWNIFVDKLAAAKDTLAKYESQAALDLATHELSDAYTNLRLKSDEALIDELKKFLDETKNLDYSKYSLNSQAKIKEVVSKVQETLVNEDISQEELVKTYELVEQARKIISNPDAKVILNDSQKDQGGKENAVTTSDTMQFASLLALAAVSLIITLVVRKHRFEA